VIRRGVGGKQVMDSQVRVLLGAAKRPNVTIEVLPFSVGVYPGMHSPFVIDEFSDSIDTSILHVENPRGELIIRDRKPEEVTFYRRTFDELRKLSPGPRGSIEYLRELLEEN
jgi:hypothetical protein